ncbi:MAG: T9SS type A sorting domain-containing protein, partial [Bacteroidales bacterium]|nr:T9SS type A sorting domain-containing protein [Bacteroidales bacterium]
EISAIAYNSSGSIVSSSIVDIYILLYDENLEIINLFPNPTNGHFSIELLSDLQDGNYKVTVLSITGETVYSGIISNEEYIKQFDLSYLKPGTYILTIMSDEIIITKKFIKK